MEDFSSVMTIFRKRKKNPSPSANQLVGVLTRSKAQMSVHRNRSGFTRPDVISEVASPVKDFSVLDRDNAWRDSLVRDLRTLRVFSPDVNLIIGEQNEEKVEEEKVSLKGLDPGSRQGLLLDISAGDMKVDQTGHCDELVTTVVEDVKKCDDYNGIHKKEEDAISGDGTIVRSKLALNLCTKRKVFKTPGSFSYRRLLPYLMDLVNDDSGALRIDLVDAVAQCAPIESRSVKTDSKSYIQSYHCGRIDHPDCHSDNTESRENEEMQKFQSGVPCNKEGLRGRKDGADATLENIGPVKMEQRSEASMSRLEVSMEEESIQMTPPDPDIFTQSESGVNKENVESRTRGENQLSVSNYICLDQSSDRKHRLNSVNSVVLRPCSGRRVFKQPRSLSYRRLLPFLTEMSNHNSIKPQKLIGEAKEKPNPLPAATYMEEKDVEIIRTASANDNQPSENLEEILRPATIPSLVCSSLDTGANPCSSTHTSPFPSDPSTPTPKAIDSENGASPCMNFDAQTEVILKSKCSPRKLDSECPQASTDGFETNEQTAIGTAENPELIAKNDQCLDVGFEVCNDNRESTEKVHLNHGSLKCDAWLSITGPSKGILKKNPRGCRGPCNCLNCASFHLHAERAFEFSKNQMHDAEEVTSELINVMAKLRHLLEKSISDDNSPSIIPLNLVQLKQTCAESLETEKLAKERLCQMNCDLNIHCRIPALLQPKVKFSNYIQERSFPMLDQFTHLEKTE